MTYERINFVDQRVPNPRTYVMTNNDDGSITLQNHFGETSEEQLGTPLDAETFNHMEDGIVGIEESVESRISSFEESIVGRIGNIESSINPTVTNILKAMYPVGAIFISTTTTCPMSSLFGTWQLVSAGRALWTGNGSNANTTIAAGLPNITGGIMGGNAGNPYGAFVATWRQNCRVNYNGSDVSDMSYYDFNASRSNSIYGSSGTVQPPAYVVNVWRRTK